MALDEFIGWYKLEPRPGFSKATVSAWRVSLEARGLGSSSIVKGGVKLDHWSGGKVDQSPGGGGFG
jgi:hypothetical protein